MDLITRQSLEWDAVLDRLAAFAACSLGAGYVRALEPVDDIDEARARLEVVGRLLALLERNRALPLGGIEDLSGVLDAASPPGTSMGAEEWPRLARFLYGVRRIVAFGKEAAEGKRRGGGDDEADTEEAPSPRGGAAAPDDGIIPTDAERAAVFGGGPLGDLFARLGDHTALAARIKAVFDDDGLVRDSASPALAQLRASKRKAEGALARTLGTILSKYRGANVLQDDFTTQRNGRHVVPVRAGSRGRVGGILHGASSSGETLYIEPTEIVEAANDVELAKALEAEEVHRILVALTDELRPAIPALLDDHETIALLDGMNALARVAWEHGWKLAVLAERGAVRLMACHHPLLHLRKRAQSVPITMMLAGEDRTIVLSGPNAGGKTTAMKTLALAALLLQSGCPIPASPDSQLPFFTAAYADIGDHQDLGEGLSTFTGHVRRVREILDQADGRSIVLLDELGTGTDPEEGGALAIAVLEELQRRGALTFGTSHLGPVKNWAEVTDGARNASFSLDAAGRPTYKLRLDIPGASEALAIASNEGLPASVLDAARALVGEQKLQLGDLLRRIEERERQLAEAVREAEARAATLDEQQRATTRRAEELREERRRWRESVADEKGRELRALREKFERLIASLPSEEALAQRRIALVTGRRELVNLQQRAADDHRLARRHDGAAASQPGQFHKGQKVWVAAFGKWGEVVRADWDTDKAMVIVGNVQVEVATSSLSTTPREETKFGQLSKQASSLRAGRGDDEDGDRPGAAKTGKPAQRSKKVKAALRELDSIPEGATQRFLVSPAMVAKYASTEPLSMELDLHGHRVDEALSKLDKYLDRALLAGFPQVRVIHGTGAGKLYRAVHEFLREYPSVKKFRFGASNEGGGGVTIVEF